MWSNSLNMFFSTTFFSKFVCFLFPLILTCARVLYNVIGCVLYCSNSTIFCNMILFGWLL